MPIQFSPDRWEAVKENYTKMWNGTLNRPLIKAILRKDEGTAPNIPLLSQKTCHRFDISPEDIINRIDFDMSQNIYLADAYPMFNLVHFGPGVLAAFCGATLDNSTGNVWFEPEKQLPLSEIHLSYDKNNKWLNRIKDLYYAGSKKWKGNVLITMPDLGGPMDIAATFRGSENLLMDLYDEPDEVKRLCDEIIDIWFACFHDLNDCLMECGNPGFTDWAGIYSDKPTSILQNDFAYMISSDMFDEFSLEHMQKQAKQIPNVSYHLDGIGNLNHLDSLLKIDKIRIIQWVPGDGNSLDAKDWMDVYKKIIDSGRALYLVGTSKAMLDVTDTLGTTNYYYQGNLQDSYNSIDDFKAICDRLCVPTYL